MNTTNRRPKPGEKVIVAGTQAYAEVIETGPMVAENKKRIGNVWRVLCDRKGRSQVLEVYRDSRGHLHPANGSTYRASTKEV